MVRLAISKGRILEEAVQMLSSINIHCKVNPLNSRKLIIPTDYEDLEIIVIKATDVPLYIDSGKIDLGIVGMDTLMEDERNNHFILHDMSISKCKLVVAGDSKSKYFNNMKVATKYPNLTKKYFEKMPKWTYSIGRAGTYRYEVDIDDCILQSLQIYDQIKSGKYNGPIVGEKFKK